MLKTDQMKMLVGAIIGMLEENLAEENDPEVKKGIENYKKQMEELYAQILLSEFMENMMAKMEVMKVHGISCLEIATMQILYILQMVLT